MQVTLHSLVSHASFDWTCRGNKADLLKNLVVVVLQLIGISEVDSSVSSPLFKAATKIYNLAKKPKNVRQGLECFLKSEATVLKNHLVDIIGEVEEKGEDQESDGQKEVGETKLVNGKRRKNFSELRSVNSKKARLSNVVKILQSDIGLEDEVFKNMKKEREEGEEEDNEEFQMCCLNLINTIGLSTRKYDSLRYWLSDILARGFNPAAMPCSRKLMDKVKKEMVPPNMKNSESGAEFDIYDALFHTGARLLERPDVRQHLKEGDKLVHLAKVGSDFATGFGHLNPFGRRVSSRGEEKETRKK